MGTAAAHVHLYVLDLEFGASLRLAAPNPVARSFGLAGPPHAGDVPVQAKAPWPGPGRFQHRALAAAGAHVQAQGAFN